MIYINIYINSLLVINLATNVTGYVSVKALTLLDTADTSYYSQSLLLAIPQVLVAGLIKDISFCAWPHIYVHTLTLGFQLSFTSAI